MQRQRLEARKQAEYSDSLECILVYGTDEMRNIGEARKFIAEYWCMEGLSVSIGELAFTTEIQNDEDGDVTGLCVGSVVTHTKGRNV